MLGDARIEASSGDERADHGSLPLSHIHSQVKDIRYQVEAESLGPVLELLVEQMMAASDEDANGFLLDLPEVSRSDLR